MWHFHQLLRTQLQVASTTMKRVRVPFEMIASSVKLVESTNQQQQPRMSLSVDVNSETNCAVQVFWNVKASALEGVCEDTMSPQADWPIKRRFQLVDAILPTRAARSAIHAVRSLPGKYYDMDLVKSPHQLLDDEIDKNNGDKGLLPSSPTTGLCLARLFAGGDSFRACSGMERRDAGTGEYVVSVPSGLLTEAGTEEAIQSSVVATDCDTDSSTELPIDPAVDNSRYACVIAIGSTDFFDNVVRPKSPGLGVKKRLSTGTTRPEDDTDDEVLCHCVAIDFLPTPGKPRRAPMVVKKLHFTATSVLSSQEIFGRGGECVICLEHPQAAILLPCRHLCVCRACLEEIDQCPICRAKFSTYACYQSDSSSNSNHIQLQVTTT